MNPFSQFFSGNTGAKLVSAVVAVVLWVVVLGSRSVEVTKEIPLTVVTPQDLVVSNDLPEKILFRLSGPKAFLRAILDRPEDPIRVNLSGSKSGMITYRFFADNIRLPIGVRVLSVTPPSIVVKLEPQKTKEVPVRLELKNNLPEGFILRKAELSQKTVKIRGPVSRVEAITEISTRPIDLSEVRANLNQDADFDFERIGVRIDGQSPRIDLEVAAVQANYKIRIKGNDIRVDSKYRSRVDEPFVTIYVRMEQEDIPRLDPSLVSATVNLKDKNKGRYTSRVSVNLPPNVGVVRIVPDSVRVTLY